MDPSMLQLLKLLLLRCFLVSKQLQQIQHHMDGGEKEGVSSNVFCPSHWLLIPRGGNPDQWVTAAPPKHLHAAHLRRWRWRLEENLSETSVFISGAVADPGARIKAEMGWSVSRRPLISLAKRLHLFFYALLLVSHAEGFCSLNSHLHLNLSESLIHSVLMPEGAFLKKICSTTELFTSTGNKK